MWFPFIESVLTRTLYVHSQTGDKRTILLLASSIIPCTVKIVCCMHNFKRYQTPSPQARFVLWRPPHLSFLEFWTLPCARGRRVICWRPISPAENTHHYCSCPADCSQFSSQFNTIQANATLSSVLTLSFVTFTHYITRLFYINRSPFITTFSLTKLSSLP